MLLVIALVLVALWAVGLAIRVADRLIHVVLLIALVVFVLHLRHGGHLHAGFLHAR